MFCKKRAVVWHGLIVGALLHFIFMTCAKYSLPLNDFDSLTRYVRSHLSHL